ncbi:hypothetical protein Esti_004973 [Eimeria stiedai]
MVSGPAKSKLTWRWFRHCHRSRLGARGKATGFHELADELEGAEARHLGQKLLDLITRLKKWRRLLLVADVAVYIGHEGLEYLLKLEGFKQVRGRVAGCLDFLADFTNLKIDCKPGKSNIIADALSRLPYYSSIDTGETHPRRRHFDPGEKRANQLMVCLNDGDKPVNQMLKAADFVPKVVLNSAAPDDSRYHKPIVTEQ